MKKIGFMATYPARFKRLMQMLPTVTSQLDRLVIYCNEYTLDGFGFLMDKCKGFAGDCKIQFIDPGFADGDLRDMGKFWSWHRYRGYIFLLDDDLLYPSDYCQRHIKSIQHHQSISTVHGRSLLKWPIENYIKDTKSLHYKRGLDKHFLVDIAGTGTVAFSTKDFQPPEVPVSSLRANAGMADIYFALLASTRNRAIIATHREANWLADANTPCAKSSLYAEMQHSDTKQVKAINANPKFKLPS